MKYPQVIILRDNKYKSIIDKFIQDNSTILNFTPFITNKYEDLNKLYSENFHILVTFGEQECEYITDVKKYISDRMCIRWIHLKEAINIQQWNHSVNYCYINFVINDIKLVRPIF